MRNLERNLGLVLAGLGALVLYDTRRLTYWYRFGPGSGFFPFWAGLALLICGIVIVLGSRRKPVESEGLDDAAGPGRKKALSFFALLVCGVVAMVCLGWHIAFAGFCFVTLKKVYRYNSWRAARISAGLTLFVFLVFRLWLNIPLPEGSVWAAVF